MPRSLKEQQVQSSPLVTGVACVQVCLYEGMGRSKTTGAAVRLALDKSRSLLLHRCSPFPRLVLQTYFTEAGINFVTMPRLHI